MATKSGQTGTVTWGSLFDDNVHSWTLNYVADMHDKTDFTDGGNGIRTYQAGLKNWSGSFQAFVDDATPLDPPGSSASLVLKAFEVGTTDAQYTGTALVESFDVSHSVDGLVEVTVNFRGNSALTIADPAAV